MDITTLAAWGEFLGAVAVVISLVYLATQIRQGSKLLRASTTIATAQMQNSYIPLMMQDAELSQIYWNGLADYASLSEQDRHRFNPLMSMVFKDSVTATSSRTKGSRAQRRGEQNVRGMRWLFQQPGARQWWDEWREMYPQKFCKFIDDLVREGEAAG